jgi:hypothetical protein
MSRSAAPRRILRWGVVGIGVLGASWAGAQEPTSAWQQPPTVLVPGVKLATPWVFPGEPTGAGGMSPWVASTPLRLSLQSGILPTAGGYANCVSLEEPSGNTINGFPVQRFTSLRLAPALVLQGFSSAGCPVDGAIGGGLTYTAAIRPSLSLVLSAGVYGVPAHAPLPARVQSDARIDLTHQLDGRSTLSVGIGKRGITFGGAAW